MTGRWRCATRARCSSSIPLTPTSSCATRSTTAARPGRSRRCRSGDDDAQPEIATVNTAMRRRRIRILLGAMGALLVLAFGAVGLLQIHQFKLLNTTARYQDDSLVWSLFQF